MNLSPSLHLPFKWNLQISCLGEPSPLPLPWELLRGDLPLDWSRREFPPAFPFPPLPFGDFFRSPLRSPLPSLLRRVLVTLRQRFGQLVPGPGEAVSLEDATAAANDVLVAPISVADRKPIVVCQVVADGVASSDLLEEQGLQKLNRGGDSALQGPCPKSTKTHANCPQPFERRASARVRKSLRPPLLF